MTVFLAWVPVASWTVGLALYNTPDLRHRIHAGTRLGWLLEAVVLLSALFAIWLFLLMATGVPSYFFHTKRLPVVLQNRAVALSYYACGLLAWLWLPGALAGVYAVVASRPWPGQGIVAQYDVVLVGSAVLFSSAIALGLWVRLPLLMRRTIHCGAGRVLSLAVYLPIAWSLCLALALGITAIFTYLSLMILSVR